MRRATGFRRSAILPILQAASLFASIRGGSAQEVVFSRSSPTIEERGVVVPLERFNVASLEALARGFVAEMSSKKLARLTIASNKDDLSLSLRQRSLQPSYESCAEEIRSWKVPRVPIAQVLIVGGSAKLSYRDKSGLTERHLGGASNPPMLTEGKTRFEILGFFLNEPGPASKPTDYVLTMYLRETPALSISAGVSVSKRIFQLTGVNMLQTVVRRNTFFPENLHFPCIYPFQVEEKLPTKSTFETAPNYFCVVDSGREVECSGSNFVP